jgi:ABC-type uncharacterized transport system ATPase subunit
LDEPTIGLDAVSKIAVREFIKYINKDRKTTVILTTHDMQDIEALTKRIILTVYDAAGFRYAVFTAKLYSMAIRC